MNKRLITLFIFALIVVCSVAFGSPATVYAAKYATNTHLADAVSLTTHKDKLLIADNVDGNGVVHIFDETGNSKFTELSGEIVQITASDDYIYILQQTKLSLAVLNTNRTLNIVRSITLTGTTVEKIALSNDYVYFLVRGTSNDSVRRMTNAEITSSTIISASTWFGRLVKATDIAYADGWLYVLTSEGILSRNELNGNEMESLPMASTKAITSYGKTLYEIGQNTINGMLVDGTVSFVWIHFAKDNEIYILCGDGKVRLYIKEETGYVDSGVLLGSNEVDIALPFDHLSGSLSSVVLAQATGYPSNVLYEPTRLSDNTIKHSYRILTNSETFLILNYSAAQNLQYYYIFLDGKFGFVETSAKINILEPVSPSIATQKNAHQTLNVYRLPDEKLPYRTNNFTTDVQVSISCDLKNFTSANSAKWSYASVTDGNTTVTGFVLSADLKPDTTSPSITYKFAYANPSIGESLAILADIGFGEELYQLRNGQRVRVYYDIGEYSFVRFYITEKDFVEGYVLSSLLIYNGLTHNQAIGLALCLSLALLVVFTLFIAARRKKHKNKQKQADET